MIMITSRTALDNNLSQNNLHDASFASYGDENFCLLKLTGRLSQNRTSFISAPEGHLYVGKKKVEDEEIDVFDADKYFNGAMDVEYPSRGDREYEHEHEHEHEKDKSIYKSPDKPKTQPATSSVYSESSWNSQNMLLYSVRKQRKPKKGFLAKFGCRCYCNDTNSVEVDNGEGVVGKRISNQSMRSRDFVQPKSKNQVDEMKIGSKRQECFSFPVLKAEDTSVRVRLNDVHELTRNSLQVFGSPILEKGDKSLSLERKLSILNWGVEGIQIPPNATEYNGTESDASSDLFEIESLSTNPNCYPPSEASIEWSVVTASAADYSMMSDSEESRMETSQRKGKEIQKQQHRHPGILLGCKSHKSVRIAGDRINEKSTHKFESFKSNTKFQTENRVMGFE